MKTTILIRLLLVVLTIASCNSNPTLHTNSDDMAILDIKSKELEEDGRFWHKQHYDYLSRIRIEKNEC